MSLRFVKEGCFSILLTVITSALFAQSFSFNCSRDTLVPGCPANFCFTLKGIIPDIRKQTNTYTVNPTSSTPNCFPVYVLPNDPQGTPTNLTIDDTYSSLITMGFPFSFFGATYTTLAASTNGYLTFDASRAGQYAAWSIPADLPSASYDRATVMGPDHDLFPTTSQPDQRIQYQVYGTAPHRRWVLSFNRVRLFSCTTLNENTHQIVLYESLNMIEVLVFSKQTCTGWNSGRAIIGIQNWDRNAAVMAPGRTAMGPTWGSVGMNESWRFVPSAGPSLLKRVELLDNTGAVVTTLTSATDLGNGKLEVSFPNICPPVGAVTTYVIRSVYEKSDDPTVEIFGTDTVRVNRSAGLAATATPNAASCGNSNGVITIGNLSGGTSPYQYSINGGTSWQPSNIFNGLAAGSYTVTVRDASGVCTIDLPVAVVSAGNLAASPSSTPTACTGVSNGTITINTAAGTGPHTFKLDANAAVQGTLPFTFNNVAAGAHTVIVTDLATNCNSGPLNITVNVGAGVAANTSSQATSCPTAANGSVTVEATLGVAPFTFQLDGGAIQSGPNPYTFSNVSSGTHTVVIRDNLGCQLSRSVTVTPGPTLTAGVSGSATTCDGAVNGSLLVTPLSGAAPYTFSIDGGPFVTGSAPYTFVNVAAGSHQVVVRDAIGCQSNAVPVTVNAGPLLVTTATSTPALCNAGTTGTITVATPTVGQAPYQYSLDGANWQTGNQFTGLTAGTYTVRFREANGCRGTTSLDISEPLAITLSATTVAVVCNGQSNGQLSATAAGGIAPYSFSVNAGGTWQPAPVFSLTAGSYTLTVRDANNCNRQLPVLITEPGVLTATAATVSATCNGGNDGGITLAAAGGNGSYAYSVDGGINWQSANVFNLSPGTYSVTIKDQLNCVYSMNATVGLTNDLTYTPQRDTTICESKSAQLQVISNGVQYDWSPATGLSAVNIFNPVASPVSTTQYVVLMTLGRCTVRDTVVVNVNPAPIPNAGADIYICYGQSATLNGRGGTVYRWSPATYLNNASLSNAVTTPNTNIYYVLSVLSDANGCAALVTDTVYVDVTPPIQVRTFPADTIGYPGDRFQLLAQTNDPDVTIYTWTPSVGLSNAGVASPTVTVGAIGTDTRYKVVASTVAGCKGEGYVNVRVYKGPDIYVPTGFTPNGDGKNDKFTPFPVGMKSYNYFRVFNRWGQLVFQTRKLNDGWDGTIGGQLQPEGIYIWMIEGLTKDDRIITKKGSVMLIK